MEEERQAICGVCFDKVEEARHGFAPSGHNPYCKVCSDVIFAQRRRERLPDVQATITSRIRLYNHGQ